jgi:hypothetical protein
MAMTTYSELKTSIADFLNRSDLTSVISDFITLAEAQMNRDVRHYLMVERSEAEVDTQYSSLPTNFLEPIRVHINDEYKTRVELASLDDMLELRNESANATGKPQHYAIIGDSLEVYPTPDTDYNLELMYYGKIDSLSDSNTSNWMLANNPDAYLYGSLLQSAPYLKEDNRITVWASLYAGIISSINKQSQKTQFGGSGLRRQIRSY